LKSREGDLVPIVKSELRGDHRKVQAIVGFLNVPTAFDVSSDEHQLGRVGRIVVYGDSSCVEMNPQAANRLGCVKLLSSFIDFTHTGTVLSFLNLTASVRSLNGSKVPDLHQYESLDAAYYQPLVLNAPRPMTKKEIKTLQLDRDGRTWDFGR
jgi:hypothetical protein